MEKKIAKRLLEIKAVFLSPNEPFTWASGIKSPIYCDNRLTLSYPEIRTEIETGIAESTQNARLSLVHPQPVSLTLLSLLTSSVCQWLT